VIDRESVVPVLDDDGLLRFEGRWTAITDAQLPVVALLVRNHPRLTRRDDLVDAYASAGGSASTPSLRSLLHRLRTKLATVGLQLHTVRGRGVVLDVVDDDSATRGRLGR
jgi:DNA-binding response OmpR family regulator